MNRILSLEESKKCQLDILIHIDNFCRANNISYSIAYGTLLGAVRHKGFIPWDDDIDIVMLRPDYEQFVATYHDDRFKLILGKDIANHLHVVVSDNTTRVQYPKGTSDDIFYKGGVWVDVFPLDKVPENQIKYNLLRYSISYRRLLQKMGELLPLSANQRHFWKKIIRYPLFFILHPFKDYNGNKALKLMQKYRNSESTKVASLAVWYLSNNKSMPIEWFQNFCELEFEGNFFYATTKFHDYLVSLYGDYMKLPPEEERKPKHLYDAFGQQSE